MAGDYGDWEQAGQRGGTQIKMANRGVEDYAAPMAAEFSQEELDQRFMTEALKIAAETVDSEDVPVGAIVVHNQRIIARGWNQREKLQDPTAHAEMIALTSAASHVGSWRLDDCTLYVTLEPCSMCAGALVLARLPRLVFGAYDSKAGACGSLFDIAQDARLNHRVATTGGVLAGPCAEILREFFRRRRQIGD